MIHYTAAWVCPIARGPIPNGWFAVAGGRIARVGAPGEPAPGSARDLGQVAVLPGLVNAHTHLELSWMRGRIPETGDFNQWIRRIIELKLEADQHGERVAQATDEAIREAQSFGTALVGDITNTLATSRALRERGMAGVVFHELLGFRSEDAGRAMEEA